jgi:protease-4
MLVRTAEDALKYKLITNVGYYDEMLDFVRGKLGIEKDKKIHFVKPDNYYDEMEEKKLGSSSKVAVIFASGTITDGKGTRETIGSTTMAAEIRKARLDDDVKAVVLRINSPGGSALASDVMWREIVLTSKKKPIIASMSDVAASGGYYMAMGCTKIVAQPNTITGSIGVFGLLFNGENFLKNKLGVTTDREKTGKFSDVGSFTRQLSEYERKEIQHEVERIYSEFKRKAALGRKTDTATIEKYAQGRVWTGIEAKNNGLVDILGGLDDAVKLAAESAKLGTEYSVEYLPDETDLLFGKFMEDMDTKAQLSAQEQMSTYYPYFKALTELEKMKGIQARLPYEIIIK